MTPPGRPLSIGRDYLHTAVFEGLILAGQMLAFALAAAYWGSEGFGEYTVARRAVALLLPAVFVGMGIALPRYVASNPPRARAYLHAALGITGVSVVAVAALLALLRRPAANLFYGGAGYGAHMLAVASMLIGMNVHMVGYSYLRGALRQPAANRLQWCNLGVLPVAIFVLNDRSVPELLAVLGASWIVTGGAALLWIRAGLAAAPADPEARRDLLRYGVPRVPGDLLQMGLLALPTVLTAHAAGIVAAGHVAFALSLVTVVGSAYAPIGVVLLPRLAAPSVVEGAGATRGQVSRIGVLTAVTAGALALTVMLGAAPLVHAVLGREFDAAVPAVRLAMVGAVPYALYLVLRNVLDARHTTPYNVRNLAVSSVVFAAGSGLTFLYDGGALGLIGAVAAAMWALGLLTVRDVRRSLRT